jgi:tRNA threonylcarbamoyladenosine biosynthesis protein TsaE
MGGFLELATSSPEETRALGEAIAPLLEPGDVVSLTGDLGAGKTTLVQGAARGLGVEQPVLSPTFTLVRQYRGTSPVYHLDVYRLDRIQEVLDLGFDEMLDRGAVVFIEWGSAIEALLPPDVLEIELTIPVGEEGTQRRLSVSWRGESWDRRWERLAEVAEPWRAGNGG